MACGKSSPAPTSPSAGLPAHASVVGDGTLKVSAPTPISPVNGQKPDQELILVTRNSTTLYVAGSVALSYRFEIYTPAGARVYQSPPVDGGTSGTTSFKPDAQLNAEQPYQWQVRAEYQGNAGPWSSRASFIAPRPAGYIQGHELYDPLIDGVTVGNIHGPVTFIPGVGVRLDSDESYIEYRLPETLTAGEYSALFTNLSVVSSTEDPKWRIMTMREGDGQINDNIYRMSVDKRGNGAIAWRFVSGNSSSGEYIETIGQERQVYSFHEALTYFVKATWNGGVFRVQIWENGVDGDRIYDFGKGYDGVYQPLPHMVFAGSPFKGGDRGEPSSVDGMIVRQIWVSDRPRPAFANQ
jgi:hypothetical protein